MNSCAKCGAPIPPKAGRGRKSIYCGTRCRDAAAWQRRKARQPDGPIQRRYPSRERLCSAGCGKIIVATPGRSAPAPMCRECRQSNSGTTSRNGTPKGRCTPCIDCGEGSYGKRCRPCSDRALARSGRDQEARRALERRRAARLRQAPGLTGTERLRLLAAWVQQGRTCMYCPGPADSVDHVIPIALGGTNYEGNLVPACRACNSRKNDSLLIEWKNKRRTRRERVPVALTPPVPRVTKGKTRRVHFPTCERCDVLFTARTSAKRFCSDRCMRGLPEVHHCADCGVEVETSRYKCDACILTAKRVRKREYKRRLRARRAAERQALAA